MRQASDSVHMLEIHGKGMNFTKGELITLWSKINSVLREDVCQEVLENPKLKGKCKRDPVRKDWIRYNLNDKRPHEWPIHEPKGICLTHEAQYDVMQEKFLPMKLASALKPEPEKSKPGNPFDEEKYEAERARLDKELDDYAAERDRVLAMKPHYTMAIKILENDIEMFNRYYIYRREIIKAYGVQFSREEAFKEWSEMTTDVKNSFKPK